MKKKQYILYIIIFVLLCALSFFIGKETAGSSNSRPAASQSASGYSSPAASQKLKPYSDSQVVADFQGLKITYTGLEPSDDNSCCKACFKVENSSTVDYNFSANMFDIGGDKISFYCGGDIAPHTESAVSAYIYPCALSYIRNLQDSAVISFTVKDSDYNYIGTTEPAEIKLPGLSSLAKYNGFTGTDIIDTDAIKLSVLGGEAFDNNQFLVLVKAERKSDHTLYFSTPLSGNTVNGSSAMVLWATGFDQGDGIYIINIADCNPSASGENVLHLEELKLYDMTAGFKDLGSTGSEGITITFSEDGSVNRIDSDFTVK